MSKTSLTSLDSLKKLREVFSPEQAEALIHIFDSLFTRLDAPQGYTPVEWGIFTYREIKMLEAVFTPEQSAALIEVFERSATKTRRRKMQREAA